MNKRGAKFKEWIGFMILTKVLIRFCGEFLFSKLIYLVK